MPDQQPVLYLTDRDLARRYSVCRQTIWRWAGRNVIPRPVRLTEHCTRWRLDEIERQDAERNAEA